MEISYQATSNQALHTQKGTKKFQRKRWENEKDIPTTYSKKITDTKKKNKKKRVTPQKHVLMNSNETPTCPCIKGNAFNHRHTSYRSCWGLGWGRCGAYNGPVQRRTATGRTDWGCCWPLAALGPARAESPNCSGWGWKAGSGRMNFAAAVAAGMLWLVDYHCSAGWGGI